MAIAAPGHAETLETVPTHDAMVVHRWKVPGDPRGVAFGADGTIYVGLAQPQAVIAIDPKSGAVRRKLVLDSADIASTKELLKIRTDAKRTRLFIANGSDESASILAIPALSVVREITIEGETVRDVAPDPKGSFIYVLGRRLHVYDATGETELRTLDPSDVSVTTFFRDEQSPLSGIRAYATAYDPSSNTVAATDRAGFLTIYSVPPPALAK